MTYDHELTLIKQKYKEDDLGQRIPDGNPVKTTVLCNKKSVGRTEFYNASVAGMKPELIFIIHGFEYNNQEKVEYNGTEYDVIRTYQTDFDKIELTVGSRLGNG